ncbi:MAG: 30S ribosome-binding factor RbfA [Phycisphaerae bacterium]|nr:30S ribosome-binding factor RbfA [Phycisphaerae bacterium]
MKPYRLERMASEVRAVVGDAITNRLSDPRISPFASVTRVSVSTDSSVADVYVSVMGDEGEQRKTLAGLKHARGHLQGMVAKRLRTRQCPTIRFHLDDSIKRGIETIRAIDDVMGRTSGADAAPSSPGGDDA